MKRILIVDDEKNLRELIKLNLESKGFECLVAEDGRQALKITKENKKSL